MYWCDWTLELPVVIDGHTVAWCPDIDVRLILNEDGDLWKVKIPTSSGDVTIMSGIVFDIALEVMERDGDRIRHEAEVPPRGVKASVLAGTYARWFAPL